jgi:hypothetical protein
MALARFEEWKERIITYVGGGNISLYNKKVLAKAQETAKAVASSGQSVERLISTAGLVLIRSHSERADHQLGICGRDVQSALSSSS